MILGMGVVFLFLTIMVFALKAQAILIAKYFTKPKQENSDSKQWKSKQTDNKNTIAAISAAIVYHNQ